MADRIRVLAVDDAVANLAIVKGCLRGNDFELKTCTNAIDALQLFKDNFFDVILLDVIMPGITGFELRKLIREIDTERPIIFFTSMVDDGSMTMLNQIAWDPNTYYLNKFTDRKVLIQKITEVCNLHRRRQIDKTYSHKLESELKLAGDLQKLLLPKWFILNEKVKMSSLYVPAMQVSGDVFEFFELSDGRFLLFVGDIAGHGISAALYMTTVLAYLKVKCMEKDITPEKILDNLNAFFCKEIGNNAYMTAQVIIFDFEKNHLLMHNAGHVPLLLCSPSNGKITSTPTKDGSLPVGWFEDSKYESSNNYECDFADDTIFLASSDGVMDIANESNETLNYDYFTELLEALVVDTNLTVLPYRLMHMIEQMGYNNRVDDITLLAVQKRMPNPDKIERLIPQQLAMVDKIASEFSTLSADLRQISQIELCVHEFLNNIIIHGNNIVKNNKPIYAAISKKNNKFELNFVESGNKWDPAEAVRQQAEHEENTDDNMFATSGRGIQILQSITESISYNSYFGINETCFIMKGETDNDK